MPQRLPNAARGDALTSDLIEDLMARVSVRAYTDAPVEDALIDVALRAGFRAPTSSNIQSYSVIVVRDPETKAALAETAGGQKHIAACPVYIAFCADLTRIEGALQRHDHTIEGNNMEVGLVSAIDASLVGMSAYLAARSLGLAGVFIGGIRNDASRTAEILGLPRHVWCVFGLCLGWPDTVPPQKPRMEPDVVIHRERYGQHGTGIDDAAALDAYDALLAAHYEATGRKTTPDSWTHDMDKKFSPQLRPNLREQLAERGFDFL